MKVTVGNIAPQVIAGQVVDTVQQLAIEGVVQAFRYQGVKVLTSDQVTERSIFGTPIFMSLTFEAFQWTETTIVDGQTSSVTHKVPKFHIPCVICEVSFQKQIVKTFVQRQQVAGSFKEHINFGDYAINIKGILSNDNDQYPLDLVNFFNQICLAPVSIEVTNTILNKLGIYNMVIDSGSPIEDIDGRQNLQPFSLSCISDDSRSLTINVAE